MNISQAKEPKLGDVVMLPLSAIHAGPQVRTKFSGLLELGADIKRRGLLQPIVVQRDGDGYRVVIGERRFRAMQIAGCPTAAAIIADVKDAELMEIQLIENIQREDLGAKDLMEAIKVLWEKHGSVKKVADALNKSQGWVSKKLATALQMGPLTGKLLEADVKDGELLYAFAKLENIDTAAALDLVPEIIDKRAGRKEVQQALKDAIAQTKDDGDGDGEDTTGDLFADSTPALLTPQQIAEEALTKINSMIEKHENRKIITAYAIEALVMISHAK